MAVNYTNKKQNWVSELIQETQNFRESLANLLALRQEALDNEFQQGGANAINDADLNGGTAPFPHLAATDLVNVLAAALAVDTALAVNSRTHYKAIAKLEP